jgi:hypothetical protein
MDQSLTFGLHLSLIRTCAHPVIYFFFILFLIICEVVLVAGDYWYAEFLNVYVFT